MLNIYEFARMFHSSSVWMNSNKLLLSKLRKKTGYTFVNCKKALEVNNNDLAKAEQWLKEQALALGWAKATKLANRSAQQGLIALAADDKTAALVEVNCETDFVSKNGLFHNLVIGATNVCFNIAKEQTQFKDSIAKLNLDSLQLRSLKGPDGKNLEDEAALLMSQVGEKVSLKRALCLNVTDDLLVAGCTHPTAGGEGSVTLGRYGSVLVYKTFEVDRELIKPAAAEESDTPIRDIDDFTPVEIPDLVKQLCQHVIGMKPAKIGNPEEDKPKENKEEETCLIHQDFIMDVETPVLQVLCENGVTLVDFARFECGEEQECSDSSEEEKVAAEAAK